MSILTKYNYNKLTWYLSALYVCFVYFSLAISNICLGLCFIVFVVGLITKQIHFSFTKLHLKLYVLIGMPFMLTTISVLNSFGIINSLDFLWLRLPVILLPLVILNLKLVEQRDFSNIVRGYLAFSLLATAITLFNAIKVGLEYGRMLDPDLTKEYITPIQHPYYGIFTLIAIITTHNFDKIVKKQKTREFLILFFSVGVLLSTSRIAMILLFSYLVFLLFKNKKMYKIAVIGGLTGMIFIIVFNTELKTKILNTFTYQDSPRAWLWTNSYKILKYSNHKTLGAGIGDYYRVKRSPRQFIHSQKGIYGYNPHNQYLEFFITNGVFGFLYLFAILYLLFLCYKAKILYSIIIVVVICLFSFTECIFNRQFGIQLYAFFLPVSMVLVMRKQTNIK